ncbi:hypothetical protein V6N13_014843 [Hibiscus sabdariffa]
MKGSGGRALSIVSFLEVPPQSVLLSVTRLRFFGFKVLGKGIRLRVVRPWGIAKYIAEIDSLVCGCVNVQFKSAEISNMAMVGSLAYDGLSRSTWLVAWW